jgi:hypothetical protein
MRKLACAVCLVALLTLVCGERPTSGEEAKARLLGRVKGVNVEENLFTVTILEGQVKGAGEDARGHGDDIIFGVGKETEIRGVNGLAGLTVGRRAWITYEPREIPGARHFATLVDVLIPREGDEGK